MKSARDIFPALTVAEFKVKDMIEKDPAEFENLEQEVFKALENQKRRDSIRLVGEKKVMRITTTQLAKKRLTRKIARALFQNL